MYVVKYSGAFGSRPDPFSQFYFGGARLPGFYVTANGKGVLKSGLEAEANLDQQVGFSLPYVLFDG